MIEQKGENLEEIRSLLKDYTEEILGSTESVMTVERLIESHRHIRDNFREVHGTYKDARKQGYEDGLRMAAKAANSRYTLMRVEDLAEMTLLELVEFLNQSTTIH